MRPSISRYSLSTIPEEHSCLSDSRESHRPVTPFLHLERQQPHCANHSPKNTVVTLEDYDNDNENDGYQETSFSNKKRHPMQRAQTPAWTQQVPHKGCHNNNKQRHCRTNANRNSTLFREGPAHCPPQEANEGTHHSHEKRSTNATPSVIHVHSSNDNRVTTKLKATLSFEYETSHPFSPRYD